MSVEYTAAGSLVDRFARARESFDGDAFIALFTEHAEYREDPFHPPHTGHDALRAYLLHLAERQDQPEFTIERHWVAGATVLAAWHASFVERVSHERVRLAGVLTMEVAADGRIERYREWWMRAPDEARQGA